jgi:DNA polymerase-1
MSLAERFKQFLAERETVKPVADTTAEKVLLIDGLNSYLRAFAAAPTMNDDGAHVGGVTGFLMSIGAAIRLFTPSRVIIVFDGAGGSQRRRKLFPDYKANRRNMTKLNRTYDFTTLEEEKESQKWQLMLLVSILNCLPVTVFTVDLVEADDVIAYLAQHIESKEGKAIISSTDKDFLQLVNENITVWNPIKKKMYTPERVVEDYEFHPNNFLLYRMVTGDNSDGIPGVDGIKEKTLLKFFPELAHDDKRDLDFLFESAQRQAAEKKKPPVALQSFLASKDLLERNYQLMRLDEVQMSGNTRLEVLDKYNKPPNEYKKMELTKLLQMNKLMSAFSHYESWLQSTFVPLMRYKLKG